MDGWVTSSTHTHTHTHHVQNEAESGDQFSGIALSRLQFVGNCLNV